MEFRKMVTITLLDCKEIQPVHSKGDQSWVFFGRNDAKAETPIILATSCKELTHWKRLWCWEGLEAGGEGDDRGWDGWMASPTRWTRVWVNSGSWWWTGRPGMLQFMGSKRVGHDWVSELNWTELMVLRLVWDCSMYIVFLFTVSLFLLECTSLVIWFMDGSMAASLVPRTVPWILFSP